MYRKTLWGIVSLQEWTAVVLHVFYNVFPIDRFPDRWPWPVMASSRNPYFLLREYLEVPHGERIWTQTAKCCAYTIARLPNLELSSITGLLDSCCGMHAARGLALLHSSAGTLQGAEMGIRSIAPIGSRS